MICHKKIKSVLGDLHLYATDTKVVSLYFGTPDAKSLKSLEKALGEKIVEKKTSPLLLEAEKQIKEYLSGKRKTFKLPLQLNGTEFQKKAWKELTKIPFGKTISYGQQAQKMGCDRAVRAVGSANGRNPLPLIVPCHRVIQSTGGLGGFSGGLNIKKRLLAHEQSFK